MILGMGKTYLSICTLLCLGIVMFSIYEKLLQSTGKTVYSTIAQVAGAVANIILDPILIFGYFHLPKMGIAGTYVFHDLRCQYHPGKHYSCSCNGLWYLL